MNDFKKEILPSVIYIVIVLLVPFISVFLNVDATKTIAFIALYLSLSNLVNKENK